MEQKKARKQMEKKQRLLDFVLELVEKKLDNINTE